MKTSVFVATWIVVMQPAALAATGEAAGRSGSGISRIEKVFFSEEKNQKTFASYATGEIRDLVSLIEPAGK